MRTLGPAFLLLLAAGTGFADESIPPDFVSLSALDSSILVGMRYNTDHNFIGRKINGYSANKCLLTKPAAVALIQVENAVKKDGYTLKMYDCYRPQRAVDDFVAWASDLKSVKMQNEFYPRVAKENLFKDGYIAKKSGHSRGSTMDLTLVRLPAGPDGVYKDGQKLVECFQPLGMRFLDNGIDMGTGFDCFDLLAHVDNSDIAGAPRKNRDYLQKVMSNAGFHGLAEEWWHFTLNDEPFPTTYFDFEVK